MGEAALNFAKAAIALRKWLLAEGLDGAKYAVLSKAQARVTLRYGTRALTLTL